MLKKLFNSSSGKAISILVAILFFIPIIPTTAQGIYDTVDYVLVGRKVEDKTKYRKIGIILGIVSLLLILLVVRM